MYSIKFENVGKQYRLGRVGTGTLGHDLNRWWQTTVLRKEDPYLKIGETNDRTSKGNSDYVWALRDISFEVEQGDVVGIVGRNGAGKSTLLKLLSHITAPSTGTIDYYGRIASLLEVGTGFHPEMTGRENIYMNGSIMGMTRQEITRKLDEIVDFAGVERYLDTPVKRYSSGMTVRLGFAVAAFLEPEILVVDEVLTVGDAEFQKKAIGKMQDVSKGDGRTVLFVSHNMDSLLSLCNKGVLLENGTKKFEGDIQSVVATYLNNGKNEYEYHQDDSNFPVFLQQAVFCGNNDQQRGIYNFNESVEIDLKLQKTNKGVFDPKTVLSICILTARGTRVCTDEISLADMQNKEKLELRLHYPASLVAPGSYYFRFDIHIPNVALFDGGDICNFSILDADNKFAKYGGGNNGFIIMNPGIDRQ